MEPDKIHDQSVTVSIDGQETIRFLMHSFHEVLEAFMEQRF